jgi:membrane-associated protease RseP (regulator of RpoE activity)
MLRPILLASKLAIACGLAIALAPHPVCGQSFLNRLEDQLGNAQGAGDAAAADADATLGKGYLGLEPDETDQSGRGVKVIRVTTGAPADQGGLKAQDTITAINGTPIRELDDLDKVLAASSVGSRLTMTIVRAGQTQSKTVTLGHRPGSNPAAENPGEAPPMPETTTPSLPTGGGLLTPPSSTPPASTPPSLVPPAAPSLTPPATTRPGTTRPDTTRPGTTLPGSTVPGSTLPGTIPPAGDPLAPAGDLPGSTDPEPGLTLPAPPASTVPGSTLPGSALPSAGDPADPALETPPSAGAFDPSGGALSPNTGAASRPSLGIKVVALNDTTRLQYSVRSPVRQGALIVDVRPSGPADTAGLPLGGVIVSVDGALVKDDQDLVEAVSAARPGQEIELRYYQEEQLATKTVRLGSLAAVGTAPVPSVPAARPGLYPGAPADGPLTRRFEGLVDPALRESPEAPVGSTIMDPRRVAEMYEELKALKDKVQALEDKVRQLEGGRGAP